MYVDGFPGKEKTGRNRTDGLLSVRTQHQATRGDQSSSPLSENLLISTLVLAFLVLLFEERYDAVQHCFLVTLKKWYLVFGVASDKASVAQRQNNAALNKVADETEPPVSTIVAQRTSLGLLARKRSQCQRKLGYNSGVLSFGQGENKGAYQHQSRAS